MIRKALYIANPLALMAILIFFEISSNIYLVLVGVALTIFSVIIFTKKIQWLEKAFFVAYGLFFAVCTLLFPMAIVFALTGGIWLTV